MSYKSCLKSRNITALAVCMSLFAVLLFAGGCGKNIVPAKEPPASGTDDAAPADENEMPEPSDESPAEVEYRTKSYMDVICAASGIAPTDDGSFLVTDAYNKVVWMVRDGKSTVYAGGDTVEDLYGEPVGGYNDAEYEESLFSYPWAIAPFLGGCEPYKAHGRIRRKIFGILERYGEGCGTDDSLSCRKKGRAHNERLVP